MGWQELLDAGLVDGDLERVLERTRTPLAMAVEEARSLREAQRNLTGSRKLVTQRLRGVMEDGKRSARRLRWLMKSQIKGMGTAREGRERRETMRETTRSGLLGEWQRLSAALQANQTDLPQLESYRTQLNTLLGQAENLFQDQASLTASKQEASQNLAAVLSECQRLATVLRFALKQFYGPTAEKLAEYGIQPFRGRARKVPPPPAESPDPADPVPAAVD